MLMSYRILCPFSRDFKCIVKFMDGAGRTTTSKDDNIFIRCIDAVFDDIPTSE